MPSTDGAKHYHEHRNAITTSLVRRTIAILHIDGNHSYNAVKADIESWGEFVVDGGWIIFDGYIWKIPA